MDRDPSGLVFDIRGFSLHDGPGIRTTVFFKGCPLRCLWCCNPESQQAHPETVWIAERCVGCNRCLEVCTLQAIRPSEDGARLIDPARCDGCGRCVPACPGMALQVFGRRVTVAEVLAEAARDALYAEHSGGGLTLSGGEPLGQPEFALELLRRYRTEEKGAHTAIETSGEADWGILETLLPVVDLFLYDLKHVDPAVHRRLTGRGNERVLENARRLAAAGAELVIRIPLVDGMNDDAPALAATADFVASLRSVRRVDLLPYHRLGEPKYRRLGRRYALEGKPACPPRRVEEVCAFFTGRGFEVRVGG
ncbi:MAG: glycyl-radical enzyme activating protein [Desulfobacterales bacterium]